MEQVVSTANLLKALQRVKQNRGAPGMDGVTVQQLDAVWREQGDSVRQQLLAGDYRPQPVRRVEIPKPAGGVRLLGIPTVIDRLVQQALLQVLTPVFDPGFSEHSYGFRPGRSAHQAVEAARQYIEAGYTWVVDLDIEQFFDWASPLWPSPSGWSKPVWLSPWAAWRCPGWRSIPSPVRLDGSRAYTTVRGGPRSGLFKPGGVRGGAEAEAGRTNRGPMSCWQRLQRLTIHQGGATPEQPTARRAGRQLPGLLDWTGFSLVRYRGLHQQESEPRWQMSPLTELLPVGAVVDFPPGFGDPGGERTAAD